MSIKTLIERLKESITENIKARKIARAIAIAPFAVPAAQALAEEQAEKEMPAIEQQVQAPEKSKISGYASTMFVSDYVSKAGGILPGWNNQSLVVLNLSKRLSGFLWGNYDFERKGVNEIDVGLNYNIPISNKASLRVGAERWEYPSGLFGDHDNVLKAGANYKGPVDVDLDITHLVNNADTGSGTRFYLKASKTFQLGKYKGLRFSVTPSIATAELNNYYGLHGISHITPGVALGVQKGKLGLEFFVNRQLGLIKDVKKAHVWGGVNLGVSFDF